MWRGGYRCRFGVEVSCVYPISYMQDIRAEGAKKGVPSVLKLLKSIGMPAPHALLYSMPQV